MGIELDPVLASLLVGFGLSFLMTIDDDLADSTREKTAFLSIVYFVGLVILYKPDICLLPLGSSTCQAVIMARQNFANIAGTNVVSVLWLVSGVVGFTIGFSGTRSDFWRKVTVIFFAFFLVVLILKIIFPRLGY